eukprot:9039-Heterococcus_DN1.PRE.2
MDDACIGHHGVAILSCIQACMLRLQQRGVLQAHGAIGCTALCACRLPIQLRQSRRHVARLHWHACFAGNTASCQQRSATALAVHANTMIYIHTIMQQVQTARWHCASPLLLSFNSDSPTVQTDAGFHSAHTKLLSVKCRYEQQHFEINGSICSEVQLGQRVVERVRQEL